jgi:hypothetical protein
MLPESIIFFFETRVAFHAMLILWMCFAILTMTTSFRIGRAVGNSEEPFVLYILNFIYLIISAIEIVCSDYITIADFILPMGLSLLWLFLTFYVIGIKNPPWIYRLYNEDEL